MPYDADHWEEPDKRKAMTPARKLRIWTLRAGLCGECGEPVAMTGPTVEYDHRIALELLGPDEDHNLWPLHKRPCHTAKTKRDAPLIAKARRIRKRLQGLERKKKPIPGRGFAKDKKRPWPKRSFGESRSPPR